MIEQRGGENTCDYGVFLCKTGGEKQSEQLGFIADFGNEHPEG